MAEALFNRLAGPEAEGVSAGTDPQVRPHSEVVASLKEIGIDVSEHRGRLLTDELVKSADRVITMGCAVDDQTCPAILFANVEDWGLPDPKGQPPDEVREIRDEVETRVRALLSQLTPRPPPERSRPGPFVLRGRRGISRPPVGEGRDSMPRFRLRLVPRDEGFFELFVKQAQQIEGAAQLLADLLNNFEDVQAKAARLHDMEHEGDETTHTIMRRLNTTFVTPLDHEDIHQLASTLDDVMDHIDAAGDLFVLHKIEVPFPEMKGQADVLIRTAETTRKALQVLPKYSQLSDFWVEINRLENEGDRIYRQATASLFDGNFKAMDVLKWKEVIDELEAAIDRLEDVANTLEGIALKQS